jgi:hypothetical protein
VATALSNDLSVSPTHTLDDRPIAVILGAFLDAPLTHGFRGNQEPPSQRSGPTGDLWAMA